MAVVDENVRAVAAKGVELPRSHQAHLQARARVRKWWRATPLFRLL